MIVWINGPFGAGKTQVAHELRARLPLSHVYDPEEFGYALRKLLPPEFHGDDFQDIPLWRDLNRQTLSNLARGFEGPVLVPMTLVVPQYFDEIVGALRREGLELHHFTLLATRRTLLRRLRARGDGPDSWPARQIERCLDGLRPAAFATHVHTEAMTVAEVAEAVAEAAGLRLEPAPKENPLQTGLRRLKTQIRHIRR